jgi:hypothetical protein
MFLVVLVSLLLVAIETSVIRVREMPPKRIVSQNNNDYVLITSNSDFETQGWSGSGSDEDPYIIDGLEFKGKAGPYINISNVDKNFIISNCNLSLTPDLYMTGKAYSIYIENVCNFLIVDCVFSLLGRDWGGYSVFIQYANECLILENDFFGGYAISAYDVEYTEVTSNRVESCFCFLSLENGNTAAVSDNIVSNETSIPELTSVDKTFMIISTIQLDLVDNTFYGEVSTYLTARWANISYNAFQKFSEGLEIPYYYYTETGQIESIESLIIAHNKFDSGGIRFPYSSDLDVALFENNTVAGRPIELFKHQEAVYLDCSPYGQVFSYNCTNVTYTNGVFKSVVDGIVVRHGTNVTITQVNATGCFYGVRLIDCSSLSLDLISVIDCYYSINIDDCMDIVMDRITVEQSARAVRMKNCHIFRLQYSELINNEYGLSVGICTNGTIEFNQFRKNEVGVSLYGSRFMLISENIFDCNIENAHDFDGESNEWNRNSWSNYFGFGPYIIISYRAPVSVDHMPSSTLPLYLQPVSLCVYTLVLIFFVLLVVLFVFRSESKIGGLLWSRDNWILLLLLLEILVSPVVFIIGTYEKYTGEGYIEQSFWLLGSILFRAWSEDGWTYVQGPISTYPTGYRTYLHANQVVMIFLLILSTWMVWRDRKKNWDTLCEKQFFLVLLFFFICIYAISVYPNFYENISINQMRIPLPLGVLLVFLTMKYSKLVQEASTSNS